LLHICVTGTDREVEQIRALQRVLASPSPDSDPGQGWPSSQPANRLICLPGRREKILGPVVLARGVRRYLSKSEAGPMPYNPAQQYSIPQNGKVVPLRQLSASSWSNPQMIPCPVPLSCRPDRQMRWPGVYGRLSHYWDPGNQVVDLSSR